MKKSLFTLIAGLALAGTASAVNPTITPAPGMFPNMPNQSLISWEGYTIEVNPAATGKLTVYFDGNLPAANTDGGYYAICSDAEGWEQVSPMYDLPKSEGDDFGGSDGDDDFGQDGDDDNFGGVGDDDFGIGLLAEDEDEKLPGITLSINFPWLFPEPEQLTITVFVPEGLFLLTDAAGNKIESPEVEYEYQVYTVSDDNLVTVPEKGAVLESLSQVEMTWGDFTLAINPDCQEKVTCGWDNDCTVTLSADGKKATIVLATPVTVQGYPTINIPEGYFLLSNEDVTSMPCPQASMGYQVSVYNLYPSNWSTLTGPFSNFAIYGKDVKLAEGASISGVYYSYYDDDSEEVKVYALSCESVTDEALGTGLQINFPEISGWVGLSVVIPANTLSFGGSVYTSAIDDISYAVHMIGAPTVTPLNGDILGSLDMIEIDWNLSELDNNLAWNEDLKVEMKNAKGETVDITSFVSVENEDKGMNDYGFPITEGKIVIDFGQTPYTEEGNYQITLPEGLVSIAAYEYEPNPEIVLNYVVSAKAATPMENGTVAEPLGKYQPSMGYVTVTWNEQPIYVYAGAQANLVFTPADGGDKEEYVIDVMGISLWSPEEPGVPAVSVAAEEEDEHPIDAVQLDMVFELFGKVGTYTYNVPAGIVRNADGQRNPAQSFVFEVLPTSETVPTVTPAVELNEYGMGTATVAAIDEISVVWGEKSLEYIGGADAVRFGEAEVGKSVKVENNALVVSVKDLNQEPGNYEFVLMEGCVVIGGEALNGMLDITYIVSTGSLVEFAAADEDGLYRVYGLDGVNVLTTSDAADLKALSNGLYIVNGKKVLFKK